MPDTNLPNDAPGAATQPTAAVPLRSRLLMVAVDGSEQSMYAAQVAAELAPPLAADVVLVHVMDLSTAGASEIAPNETEARAELRRAADGFFAAARSRFPAGVVTQRLLREGHPGTEIVASAREWEVDFVVMGTHGRGRVATFLLGSTAVAVIRSAHCPVLTVAHDPKRTAPSPGAGSLCSTSIALQTGD
jgi:nucleotide-binding universal stress UspA family protein